MNRAFEGNIVLPNGPINIYQISKNPATSLGKRTVEISLACASVRLYNQYMPEQQVFGQLRIHATCAIPVFTKD